MVRQKRVEQDKVVARLRQEVTAQVVAGAEGAVLAPLYTQLAQVYIAQGEVANGAEALGEVAALAEAAGELLVAAQTMQAQGLLLAQRGVTPEARGVLLAAVALYVAAGDEEKPTAVAQQLVQKFPELLEDLRPYLGGELPPEAQLDQLWAEVRAAWQAGEMEAAQETLNTAVSFAQQHQLANETELTLFQNILPLVSGQIPPQLADLLWRLATTGQTSQLNLNIVDDRLQFAFAYLQGGALEPAIEQARAVRFAARDATDPERVVRYLLGSLVLAEAHNQRDERVQVLAAWLTCREFLAANLGAAGAAAIDQILDSLRVRWGEAALNTAVADYQAYTAMHGTFQA